jgi:hypothetical protein
VFDAAFGSGEVATRGCSGVDLRPGRGCFACFCPGFSSILEMYSYQDLRWSFTIRTVGSLALQLA